MPSVRQRKPSALSSMPVSVCYRILGRAYHKSFRAHIRRQPSNSYRPVALGSQLALVCYWNLSAKRNPKTMTKFSSWPLMVGTVGVQPPGPVVSTSRAPPLVSRTARIAIVAELTAGGQKTRSSGRLGPLQDLKRFKITNRSLSSDATWLAKPPVEQASDKNGRQEPFPAWPLGCFP